LLIYIGKGCTSSKISKTNENINKKNVELVHSIDSLTKNTFSKKELKDEMEKIMWKFLELEELSDKNNIPINELKYKDMK